MFDTSYTAAPGRYDAMPYRRCGRSGVLIPAVSLGLWQNFGTEAQMERIREIAHFAFDRGICHFDLANNYGPLPGAAEENFGRLLQDSFKPYRDELFISSKAGYLMWPGPYGEWGSRKYLMASLDQSLKRMKLDYVDLFYTHRFDPVTPVEETMQALVDIVRQGKALYVGVSRYPDAAARKAYAYLRESKTPCLLFQDRFNIIDRWPEKDGLLDMARDNGSGFISFSPLQQGLLTSRYLDGVPAGSRMSRSGTSLPEKTLTPALLEALRGLNALAQQRGQSLAQMSLSWLLADPRVTSVLVGASSVAQLKENLGALENIHFTEEELAAIERLSLPVQIHQH
ncbi:MAG: aldo/keto reductase [Bacteroidales bacterium]|nr:aldo/keto reductase [Bacteroidales bacterium]